MNVNDLKSSKFLSKADVEPPVLVTIVSCEEMNVALESQAPELKWTLNFKELDKPLVLNVTNGQLLAAITGSEESEDWIGKTVVLYNDKTVSYAGEITGGIRIRASKVEPQLTKEEQAAQDVRESTSPEDYVDDAPAPTGDEIPF